MQIETLEKRIHKIKEHHAPVVFWGAGEKAKGTIPILIEHGLTPVCLCDGDVKKWGSDFLGQKVISPEEARTRYPDAVYVICTWIGNYEQIAKELDGCIYYHCNYPFKVDTSFLQIENEQQMTALKNMRDGLEDDLSKEIFQMAINYKLNGDMSQLVKAIDGNSIFDELLKMRWHPDETYIDCGAYTGDTMIQFLEFCQGNYGRIRLYDGDHNNCSWMNKLIGMTRLQNVAVYDQLLWHQREELDFYTFDLDSDDYVYENGDVSEWRRDNPCSRKKEKLEKISSYVPQQRTAMRLDELVEENEKIGIIKISVVGSDMNVLLGCEKLLRSQKPAVIIEWAGCKAEDVWSMIPFIQTCNQDYKIYLRQKRLWQSSKTILYAL